MLKVGDIITCHDLDDLIETMKELAVDGIETDFDYSGDKPKLVVTEVKGGRYE